MKLAEESTKYSVAVVQHDGASELQQTVEVSSVEELKQTLTGLGATQVSLVSDVFDTKTVHARKRVEEMDQGDLTWLAVVTRHDFRYVSI